MHSRLVTPLLLRLYFARLLQVAHDYAGRGWVVVPLGVPVGKVRGKVPITPAGSPMFNWQNLDVDDGLAAFGAAATAGVVAGVGVLLGCASGGLVDVDLDCNEAREPEALQLLPPTGASFGRPSVGMTHALYQVDDAQRTVSLGLPNGKVVELRGEGGQTMFPGSWHTEAMEPVLWLSDGPPGRSAWADLIVAVERVRAYVRLRRAGHDPASALADARASLNAAPLSRPAGSPRPLQPRRAARRLPVVKQPGTAANLAAIYRGCALMAYWRERQEAGRGWSYDVWRLGAGVLLVFEPVGEAEVMRLNAAAGYAAQSLASLFFTRPTTCSELAASMVADPSLPPDLMSKARYCGTDQSPCAFRFREGVEYSPSPFRHAFNLDQTTVPRLHDRDQVRAAIEARLQAGVPTSVALLLLGGCGVGKSLAIHRWIANTPDLNVVVVVPNHALAEEQEKRLRALGVVDVVRLVGLDAVCKAGPIVKAKIEAARRVGKPPQPFCKVCSFQPTCDYWLALRAAPLARVVIATTARLATHTFWDVVGKDRVLIVDEDPSNVLVPRHAFTRDDLDKLLRQMGPRAAEWSGAGAFGTSDIADLARYLKGLLTGDTRTIAAGDVPCNVVIAEATQDVGVADLDPGAGECLQVGLAQLLAWSSWVNSNAATRPTTPVLLVDTRSGKPTVTLSWRATIPATVPVVVADATGDSVVYEKLLGRPVQTVGGPTPPKPRIVRYHDVASSRGKLLAAGKERDRALDVVRAVAANHTGMTLGLITFMPLEDEAGNWNVAWRHVGHFGLARGTNHFRGPTPIQVGVVFGTHRPPSHVVRAFAVFVLGAPIEKALDPASTRWISDRGHSVKVHGYQPGSDMARADDWVVKSEVVQAVGRFADAEVVYAITDVPLDLEEEVRAACFDLHVPLPSGDDTGRPPLDMTIPKDVARQLVASGLRPYAAEVWRGSHARNWPGKKRTIESRWSEIEAALVVPAPAPPAPPAVSP